MAAQKLFFNGIDADSGYYSLEPQDPKTFAKLIAGQKVDEAEMKALAGWYSRIKKKHWGIVEGKDPNKLEQSGWGIVYAEGISQEIKDALKPLVAWRKAQAAAEKEIYFKEMDYRTPERKNDWLVRYGYGPGPANPDKIPYYLLLVGSPEQIPYNFQTSLDVQYGVGRICFDSVVEYANYAQSVIEAEKQQLKLPRRLSFFGVANEDDPATQLSLEHLISPLMDQLIKNPPEDLPAFAYDAILKEQATKAKMAEFLGGQPTPALLFTASHGMQFKYGHELQERHQGALLCQDWPGPELWKGKGRIPEDFYFSGEDLDPNAKLWGSIAFLFACYGAGTPKYDEFSEQAFDEPGQIANEGFIARLPQRMLSHPKGGSLAVVGHVERAWSYSFIWENPTQSVRTLEVFNTAFKRLMKGSPIGFALEQFNERYAELSTDLTVALKEAKFTEPDPYEMAGMWTANNDAKNYVVLGDPAVRMMAAPETTQAVPERTSISLSPVPKYKPVKAFAVEEDEETAQEPLQEGVLASSNGGSGNGSGQAEKAAETGTDIIRVPGGAKDFGIVEDVSGALAGFFKQLGVFLSEAASNASTLRVRTYTSDNIELVDMDKKGEIIGARLRAATNIYLDGDVDQVVPVNPDGSLDLELFQVHLELLKQAESNRTEMIKSLISAATNLRSLK